MRITAHGWSRNAGDTVILDTTVEKALGRVRLPGPARPRVTELSRSPNNEVKMTVGPAHLTMGGRYQVSVLFTLDDIMRLFLLAHPDSAAVVKDIHQPPTEL